MKIGDITPQIAEVARKYEYHEPPDFLARLLVWLQDFISHVLRAFSDFLNSFRIVVPGLSDSRTVSSIMQILLYLAGIAAAAGIMYVLWNRLGYLKRLSAVATRGKEAS